MRYFFHHSHYNKQYKRNWSYNIKQKWFSRDLYPAIWRQIFQGWNKFANLDFFLSTSTFDETIYLLWFFFSFPFFHDHIATILQFLRFYFLLLVNTFFISATHIMVPPTKIHGARGLLLLCLLGLLCKCSFLQKKDS